MVDICIEAFVNIYHNNVRLLDLNNLTNNKCYTFLVYYDVYILENER